MYTLVHFGLLYLVLCGVAPGPVRWRWPWYQARSRVYLELAVEYLLIPIGFDEKVSEGHWRLARLFERLGRLDLAGQVLLGAKARGVRFRYPLGKDVRRISELARDRLDPPRQTHP